MTLADSTLKQPTLAKSLRVTRQPKSAQPAAPDGSTTSLNPNLDQLVKEIAPPNVRKIVGTVFEDLLRLLECLNPIENVLHEVDDAEATFALFQSIHDEASALVRFIREDALACEALDKELRETLDGITFAVSHDLQRVFETKEPWVAEEGTGRVVTGRLFRAHDVLTNCLQQATITLATMFDPQLIGSKLFSNSDLRYRQAVQLCEDLSTLLELVEACGETPLEPAFANLTAGIEKFRSESILCLRYSDCPQFESFCETIQLAPDAPELEAVLHQFRCYVETLLGQVRMRAVLANVFPIEFGANDIESSAAPKSSTNFYSHSDFQDDIACDPFATAV